MPFYCKGWCAKNKKHYADMYLDDNGYCSICEKAMNRYEVKGFRCKCCMTKLRIRAKTKIENRLDMKPKVYYWDMVLKEISPLTSEEWNFVVDKLAEEEKKPNPDRLKRIREAQQNTSKMKKFY